LKLDIACVTTFSVNICEDFLRMPVVKV